jgi:hypothetical protein
MKKRDQRAIDGARHDPVAVAEATRGSSARDTSARDGANMVKVNANATKAVLGMGPTHMPAESIGGRMV